MKTPSHSYSHPRYAAIDLGTNTCLLLVARWDGKQLVPEDSKMEVVRLGVGVNKTGTLADKSIDKAVEIFQQYHALIAQYRCRHVRCVATSAFREASNRDLLRKRIHAATGYKLEEISGEEEARLVLRAVQHAFPLPSGSRLIVDVGGGSTEIILEDDGRLAVVESLPLGSVRLTERWFSHDPPAPGELSAADQEITEALAGGSLPVSADALVGVGGTATTFVAMDLGMAAYDPACVHGATLTIKTLQDILARCIALPLDQRRNLPGLHPGRAEVIIAGGMILQAIMQRFGLDLMTVSDQGLRWGVVLEMIARDEERAQAS